MRQARFFLSPSSTSWKSASMTSSFFGSSPLSGPPASAGQDGAGSGEATEPKKDDVIDADFQEVDEGDKKKRA